MTNIKISAIGIGLLMLLIGLGVGYGFGGSALSPSGSHMMSDGSTMGQDIDQHFIVQMIPHHEGAIAMAKIALERSKRPEIIALSKSIIESQQKEIDDMRSWYQSWYGSAPSSGGVGMMRMGGMEGDIDVLESVSAAGFDREFLQQMIPHHEMAVMMVQMLAAGTERPEMKQLADNIRESQSREIDMMRSWLRAW